MIKEQMGLDQIDTGVYCVGHTLRTPFCPKVTQEHGIEQDRTLEGDWVAFNGYLVTSQENSQIATLNML